MRAHLGFVLPFAAAAAVAIGLCFVPLFDLLAYEFAFAMTLVAVPTGLALGLRAGRAVRAPGAAVVVAVTLALLALVPPLGIISLNALRVRVCDWGDGLAFYALLPLPTAAYVATLGVAIARLLSGRRPAARRCAALAVATLPLAAALWRLYAEPPIFVYDHVWGHFAGSLYDETITLGANLVLFRLGTLLRLLLVAGFVLLWERRDRIGAARLAAAALALLAAAALYDRTVGPRVGFRSGRAEIEAALPLVIERPGLVIHLPAHVSVVLQRRIADEHAFRLEQISARLGVTSAQPIHSYVYANADEKARLMGGRTTQIAKPWLREIYIHDPVSPHPVLAHELTHAIAGELAAPPFGVSARYGVLVNMALVEGLAEAVTPPRGDFDLDRWTRALRTLGLAPDVRQILGASGFWREAPARAYTVAGSFVRFLLARYGAPAFHRLYPAGDFSAAYGKDLDTLAREWEASIDALELTPGERRLAEEAFKQPSIFARPCAHEIAELRARAARASPAEAVALHQEICGHLGESPACLADVALALDRAGEGERFLTLSQSLISGEGITAVQRARLLEERGNTLWERGEHAAARAAFAEVQAARLGSDSERLQWVRQWALDQAEPLREPLRRFLNQKLDPLAAVLVLEGARAAAPADRTLPYLIARQVLRVGADEQALALLAAAAGHPFPSIEAERLRLVAEALTRLDRLAEAEAAFLAYAAAAPTSGERARAEDAAAWIGWRRHHAGAAPPPGDTTSPAAVE